MYNEHADDVYSKFLFYILSRCRSEWLEGLIILKVSINLQHLLNGAADIWPRKIASLPYNPSRLLSSPSSLEPLISITSARGTEKILFCKLGYWICPQVPKEIWISSFTELDFGLFSLLNEFYTPTISLLTNRISYLFILIESCSTPICKTFSSFKYVPVGVDLLSISNWDSDPSVVTKKFLTECLWINSGFQISFPPRFIYNIPFWLRRTLTYLPLQGFETFLNLHLGHIIFRSTKIELQNTQA